MAWLKNVKPEAQIYLNHGEKKAKEVLRDKLHEIGYEHVDLAFIIK